MRVYAGLLLQNKYFRHMCAKIEVRIDLKRRHESKVMAYSYQDRLSS